MEQNNLKSVLGKIEQIIIDHLKLDKKPGELDTAQDFLAEYGLNSVDALELLLTIEKEFDIEIDDEDLNADLINSINSLSQYVANKV